MGETRRESLSLNQLNYSAVTGSSTDKWTELQYAYVGGWFATLPLWVAIGLSLGGHRPFPFCYGLFGWLSAFPWGGRRPFPLFSSRAGT